MPQGCGFRTLRITASHPRGISRLRTGISAPFRHTLPSEPEPRARPIPVSRPTGTDLTATPDEVLNLFYLAAKFKRPVYVHMRAGNVIASLQAVITDTAVSGAPLHIVYINSAATAKTARVRLPSIRRSASARWRSRVERRG